MSTPAPHTGTPANTLYTISALYLGTPEESLFFGWVGFLEVIKPDDLALSIHCQSSGQDTCPSLLYAKTVLVPDAESKAAPLHPLKGERMMKTTCTQRPLSPESLVLAKETLHTNVYWTL